jgi:hAT family C-terminal dimerisation region
VELLQKVEELLRPSQMFTKLVQKKGELASYVQVYIETLFLQLEAVNTATCNQLANEFKGALLDQLHHRLDRYMKFLPYKMAQMLNVTMKGEFLGHNAMERAQKAIRQAMVKVARTEPKYAIPAKPCEQDLQNMLAKVPPSLPPASPKPASSDVVAALQAARDTGRMQNLVKEPVNIDQAVANWEHLCEQIQERVALDMKHELGQYLQHAVDVSTITDHLEWWRKSGASRSYPHVAAVARQVFGRPVTQVADERANSKSGLICQPRRATLHADHLEKLHVISSCMQTLGGIDYGNSFCPTKESINTFLQQAVCDVDTEGTDDVFICKDDMTNEECLIYDLF